MAFAAGADPTVSESCTGTRKLLSATGYISNRVYPVTVIYDDDNRTAAAYAANVPGPGSLIIRIICATAL